jgi:hypothetical protein
MHRLHGQFAKARTQVDVDMQIVDARAKAAGIKGPSGRLLHRLEEVE